MCNSKIMIRFATLLLVWLFPKLLYGQSISITELDIIPEGFVVKDCGRAFFPKGDCREQFIFLASQNLKNYQQKTITIVCNISQNRMDTIPELILRKLSDRPSKAFVLASFGDTLLYYLPHNQSIHSIVYSDAFCKGIPTDNMVLQSKNLPSEIEYFSVSSNGNWAFYNYQKGGIVIFDRQKRGLVEYTHIVQGYAFPLCWMDTTHLLYAKGDLVDAAGSFVWELVCFDIRNRVWQVIPSEVELVKLFDYRDGMVLVQTEYNKLCVLQIDKNKQMFVLQEGYSIDAVYADLYNAFFVGDRQFLLCGRKRYMSGTRFSIAERD